MRLKKGALTSTQIITIVLAVAGFIILLILLFMLGLEQLPKEEVCKFSVLARATAPNSAQASIPLKCQTKKICLAEKFVGGCEEQFAGEEDILYIRLKGSNEDKIRKIEEVSANAMFDCLDDMGWGKLDLFFDNSESFGFVPASTTCVICSRVAVDKGVDAGILNMVDINSYMKNTQIPGSELTFLQAFTGMEVSSYASLSEDVLKGNQFNIKNYNDILGEDTTSINFATQKENREMAFVFMQIKPSSIKDVLTNLGKAGATIGALSFVTPVVGRVGSAIARRIVFTPVGAIVTVGVIAGVGGYGAYNARQGQLAAAGYCGKFTSSEGEAERGCSIVQGINYNFRDINQICHSIQGQP